MMTQRSRRTESIDTGEFIARDAGENIAAVVIKGVIAIERPVQIFPTQIFVTNGLPWG